jgi:hypothetical protein
MSNIDEQFVPKVHPLSRPAEAEDPLELMAQPVAGDPRVMLECILQEFIWMGWDEAQLVRLFFDPGYPMLCELREHYGEKEIKCQVASLVERCGVLRFRETLVESDEDDDGPQLVQLSVPGWAPVDALTCKELSYGPGL